MGPPEILPSHMRVATGSVNIPIAKFPTAASSTEAPDPRSIAQKFVEQFNSALQAQDFDALSSFFINEGYWRDHLALTWAFRTLNSPPKIKEFLQTSATSKDGFRLKKISIDDGSAMRAPKVMPADPEGAVLGVNFFLTIETVIGTGAGTVTLVERDGAWKIFTFYTRLEELKGHEQTVNGRRPRGVAHGHNPDRRNWAERREEEASMQDGHGPAVLIIGKLV